MIVFLDKDAFQSPQQSSIVAAYRTSLDDDAVSRTSEAPSVVMDLELLNELRAEHAKLLQERQAIGELDVRQSLFSV